MKAEFRVHSDMRFKKPFTISVALHDDDGEVLSSSHLDGRYQTTSEARAQAMLWLSIDSYELKWGTTQVSADPPDIITEDAQ